MRIEQLQRIIQARQTRNQYGPWPVDDSDEARVQAMQDERDGDALLAETEIRHALS